MRLTDPLRPITQLLEQLKDRESRMHDKLVRARDLTIDSCSGHLLVKNGRTTEHPFQRQAFDLICAKLRTPASYMRRCPKWLVAENMNTWLRASPDRELLLRFEADECRAVLSSRYRSVSHLQLAEAVHDTAGNVLIRAEIDAYRMLLQVVNGRSIEAAPGDRLHAGMHVRNSETGYMAAELRAFCFRLVCSNGLIYGSSEGVAFRKKHVTRPDEVLAGFSLAAERAIDAGAFLPRRFADTRLLRVPDPEPVLERIAARYKLDDAEQEAVRDAWAIEPGESLYDVINALTRGANSTGLGLAAKEKLQMIGGRIATLASNGARWID